MTNTPGPHNPGPQNPHPQGAGPQQPAPEVPQQGYQQPPVYHGAMATPAKPAKPWFKKWWVWLLIVIGVFAVAGALGGSGDSVEQATQTTASTSTVATSEAAPSADETTEAPVEEPLADLTLDDGWTMDDSDGFAVYVQGYVSNNTDEAIDTYVQITFDALDADGNNLGTCIDNANTIDAGGKWKFKAICLDNTDEIAEVRFKDITGF